MLDRDRDFKAFTRHSAQDLQAGSCDGLQG
jgi:hypothetical protein